MFERNLNLSTETINGAHIERVSFEISKHDGAGIVHVWTMGGRCWSYDPRTADGRAVLAYAGLDRKYTNAHYLRQIEEYNHMVREGQIAPGDQFEPVEPEATDIF
jgi:hypothetical protein